MYELKLFYAVALAFANDFEFYFKSLITKLHHEALLHQIIIAHHIRWQIKKLTKCRLDGL